MRIAKKIGVIYLTLCILLSGMSFNGYAGTVNAAKKPKLNWKVITIKVGKKKTVKVKNLKKKSKVTWKSKNKSIATVSKKGKITGKKPGRTKVYCTVKSAGKKYRLKTKVVVKDILDGPCIGPDHIVTLEPAPTGVSVTEIPTQAPTEKPTDIPTDIPTEVPVKVPTEVPTEKPTQAPTAVPTPTPIAGTIYNISANTMSIGGTYTGTISTPFTGVALYGNGDYCSTMVNFPSVEKSYKINVTGATSTSGTTAGASVYIDGTKAGEISFTSVTGEVQSVIVTLPADAGSKELKLVLETDTGANDTYISKIEIEIHGDVVLGAAVTGEYRNLFAERGKSETEIKAKIDGAWNQLFYGNDNERIYYPVGNDMAYIYTVDSDDVRSEGMSYGMMICVQMNKKKEFDRLWKWARTYMYHESGDFQGFFAWQCRTDGTKCTDIPASDGDEYFVTALLFASKRWGDGEGIYDYNAQAQTILYQMAHQADDGSGFNMFDKDHKLPVFCPSWGASSFTDPSYHLPAFYEVWARTAENDNSFWREVASSSRSYFKKAINKTTGLGPDYSEFDGTPRNDNGHQDFRFDAWRIASNIACDYSWWAKDSWATTYADTLQSFFISKGIQNYGNQWTLAGEQLSADHSPGLVAMNAVASLATKGDNADAFVDELWNARPTTGTYRYYDGCLYMMGLLHCSGNFKAYY